MKTLLTLFTASAMLMCACTAEDNLYSQYRVFFKNSFVTPAGTILESAGFGDTVKYVYDRGATVKGYFEYTDPEEIVRFGHCWAKGHAAPVISSDSSNCTFNIFNGKSSEKFESKLSGLDFETEYSVRSFIITANGTIGYNPNITHFTTSEPHDEWYDLGNLNSIMRADGICATTVLDGDTITFFGLGRNAGQCYCDFYQFNGSTGETKKLKDFPGNARWGAAAFVLNYEDHETKELVQCVYVGLGCSDPQGRSNSYENDIFVYDIRKGTWTEVRSNFAERLGDPFTGLVRTNPVAFAIDDCGFIGLGENADGACHSDFYIFLMSRNNNNAPLPSRGYFYTMTKEFDTQLSGASVFLLGKTAYLVGGKNSDGVYTNDLIQCTFVNPGSREADAPYYFEWQKKAPFPGNPRAFGAATAVNGYAYYGTGESTNENGMQLYSDYYRYDPSSNRWSQCADCFKKVSRSFAIPGNDRCYLGAGYTGEKSDSKYQNFLWEYRP